MELFAGDDIAQGYATARPAVHSAVVGEAFAQLGAESRRHRILDVGCGAGASTRAAAPWARTIVGLDPEIQMVRSARTLGGGPRYTVGAAEAIPLGAGTVDVLTAAGALNFVDLERFRSEAARVLVPKGVVVVYDFATGCRSSDAPALERAYDEFARRWPRPTDGRHAIDAGVLAAAGFSIRSGEPMTVPIAMNADAYVAYLMTETNVAAAVQRGEPAVRVRQWCDERFSPLLSESPVVEFDAWWSIVTP